MPLRLPFTVLVRVTGLFLITTKKGVQEKHNSMPMYLTPCRGCRKAPEQSGGRYERLFFLNALRNTVAPYKTASGEWKIPYIL